MNADGGATSSLSDPPRLLTRAFMADPYPEFSRMRSEFAAVPIENGGFRMWIVTRFEDARDLLADTSLQRNLVKHRHRIVEQDLIDIERRPKLPREL